MLQTHDLHVTLDAEAGLVRALDGLSLTLERGDPASFRQSDVYMESGGYRMADMRPKQEDIVP